MKATKDVGGDHRFWFTTFDEIDAEICLHVADLVCGRSR